MRATLFILVSFLIMGLSLWATLSGALFVVAGLLWLGLAVITVGYSDTMVLYLLGAREVRSSDEKEFFAAASQEAYKLAVKMPVLYFYNGTLERAFVLQNQNCTSIIVNKNLLDTCSALELQAICFELLLQVKKGLASKRTKTMFCLGTLTWGVHSIMGLFLKFIPSQDIKKAVNWFLSFLLFPLVQVLFKLMMGKGYYKKLAQLLAGYPHEKDLLDKVGLKLRSPVSYYSLPSRKLMELTSVNKSYHYQNILALEFLPHEWDFLFVGEELKRAE